jgi:hypothetical protein
MVKTSKTLLGRGDDDSRISAQLLTMARIGGTMSGPNFAWLYTSLTAFSKKPAVSL